MSSTQSPMGNPPQDPFTMTVPRFKINISWSNWLSNVYNLLRGITMSGTTALRPTKFLWTGRPYFDSTLGKPIWLKSVSPTVWVDATGASV